MSRLLKSLTKYLDLILVLVVVVSLAWFVYQSNQLLQTESQGNTATQSLQQYRTVIEGYNK